MRKDRYQDEGGEEIGCVVGVVLLVGGDVGGWEK